jgi:hypothetical protein
LHILTKNILPSWLNSWPHIGKHEIKLTCTFEDNLTLKNETLEGHI